MNIYRYFQNRHAKRMGTVLPLTNCEHEEKDKAKGRGRETLIPTFIGHMAKEPSFQSNK